MLCMTLALAPLRLLSDPVLEAARAWGAWREHMAESVADPQVGLRLCIVMPKPRLRECASKLFVVIVESGSGILV